MIKGKHDYGAELRRDKAEIDKENKHIQRKIKKGKKLTPIEKLFGSI
jgi:hypothetical protein